MTAVEAREKGLALVSAFRSDNGPAANSILDEFYAEPGGINQLAAVLGAFVNVLNEHVARFRKRTPDESWGDFCIGVLQSGWME